MADESLRFVFAPWGADSFGEDVWLLENGLVFCLELLLETIPPAGFARYADLYAQLGGEDIRTRPVRPLSEADLMNLAGRAPSGTDAIVDGILAVESAPETGAMTRVTVAPRLTRLPDRRIEAPDAFVFDRFDPAAPHAAAGIAEADAFYHLAFAVGMTILAAFDIELPPSVGPESLAITSNWSAFALFIKAKRLAKTPEEKLGYYRQAIKLDARFYWAHYNAGQLYKQAEDYTAARRSFLASARDPKADDSRLSDVYFELGLCSILLGDTKAARSFWDEALRFAPDNPTLLVNIAGTYEQEEDWRAAMALHERALDIDPDYHKALVSLARLCAATGDLDRAIPLYHRALDIEPDDALRQAILGGCYLAQGNVDDAARHLRRASELDPPSAARGSSQGDDTPGPGEYARAELAKLAR